MMRLRARAAALAVMLVGMLPTASDAQSQALLAPPATLERIAALLERNDLASAKAAAEPALRTYPGDPALHNFAGVIDAQQGAFEAAESHFQTAIRLAPRGPAAYTNLGRLYQERAGMDPAALGKALDVYRRLLLVDPSNVEGLYQSGFLLALGGKFAESRALIDRLPADVRSGPQVLAVLAADLQGVGDDRGARDMVTALSRHAQLTAADVLAVLPAFARIQDDGVLQGMLEALASRGLASSELLQRLAAIHLRHGRFAEARAVLERAATPVPTVPVLIDLARVANKSGDAKGALGYLAHARALEPQNAQVHFLFGMICVEQNLGGEAYDSLKKAVELDPENPLINYAMGAVSMHRHDPSESVPYFERYMRLQPNDPRGRFALGAARFYSKQLDEARRDLEVAARSTETATGAHFFLGRISRELNDLESARREIDLTLRANPTYADAWAELGLLQTRGGQYAEAEASLTKALSLDPENYDATMNLAALYGRTKDPRRAEQEARLAKLIEQREARMQEFLRLVQVVP